MHEGKTYATGSKVALITGAAAVSKDNSWVRWGCSTALRTRRRQGVVTDIKEEMGFRP